MNCDGVSNISNHRYDAMSTNFDLYIQGLDVLIYLLKTDAFTKYVKDVCGDFIVSAKVSPFSFVKDLHCSRTNSIIAAYSIHPCKILSIVKHFYWAGIIIWDYWRYK